VVRNNCQNKPGRARGAIDPQLYGATGAAAPLSHAVSLAPPIHPVNDLIIP